MHGRTKVNRQIYFLRELIQNMCSSFNAYEPLQKMTKTTKNYLERYIRPGKMSNFQMTKIVKLKFNV